MVIHAPHVNLAQHQHVPLVVVVVAVQQRMKVIAGVSLAHFLERRDAQALDASVWMLEPRRDPVPLVDAQGGMLQHIECVGLI